MAVNYPHPLDVRSHDGSSFRSPPIMSAEIFRAFVLQQVKTALEELAAEQTKGLNGQRRRMLGRASCSLVGVLVWEAFYRREQREGLDYAKAFHGSSV